MKDYHQKGEHSWAGQEGCYLKSSTKNAEMSFYCIDKKVERSESAKRRTLF